MGLWGGARGLSSHLDESSIFKMNLIESRSPLRPRVWNLFKLFPPDSADEADLPHFPSVIPEQRNTLCFEPAARNSICIAFPYEE